MLMNFSWNRINFIWFWWVWQPLFRRSPWLISLSYVCWGEGWERPTQHYFQQMQQIRHDFRCKSITAFQMHWHICSWADTIHWYLFKNLETSHPDHQWARLWSDRQLSEEAVQLAGRWRHRRRGRRRRRRQSWWQDQTPICKSQFNCGWNPGLIFRSYNDQDPIL